MLRKICKLLTLSAMLSNSVWASTQKNSQSLHLRFDCLYEPNKDPGVTQGCIRVTGLELKFSEQLTPFVKARVSLSPFYTPTTRMAQSAFLEDLPETDTMLRDYQISWAPLSGFIASLGRYDGSMGLPLSELSMGSRLVDYGWEQTALTLAYPFSWFDGTKVSLVLGNGEGENLDNMDPHQFVSAKVSSHLLEGVRLDLGFSLDKNSVGSKKDQRIMARYKNSCRIDDIVQRSKTGFETRRVAVGLSLDGNLKSLRGLKVGLGYLDTKYLDLNEKKRAYPSFEDLLSCPQLDPDSVFIEDEGERNEISHTTTVLNLSYRILDTYFLAFDFQSKTSRSKRVAIYRPCHRFKDGSCELYHPDQNNLNQKVLSYGFGMELSEKLNLSIEYGTHSYDQLYAQFYFPAANNQAKSSFDVYNVRLAYHWQ